MTNNYATIKNRTTGKSVRVKLYVNDKKLICISSRSFNSAIQKLGIGSLETDTSFVVLSASGYPVGSMDSVS